MSEVLIDKHEHIATIQINRPDQRNALTLETPREIYEAVRDVSADDSVRVVIFRGVGKDFCCGADINAAAKADESDQSLQSDLRIYDTSLMLHEMRAVTIAAIRGGCAGAGFSWACACDLRVGSTNVRMNTAFLNVAVAGDMAGPWFLSRIVGSGLARDLYFLPRKLEAPEALSIGLLNRVFADESFESELAEMAGRIASAAPLALAAMKSNFVEAERTTLPSYIALEGERHERLLKSEDRKEAFMAFLEKRKAIFKGA